MDKQNLKISALIQNVAPYKQHLNTIVGWNEFRKNNSQLKLPHSNTLKMHFGTWEDVKSEFDLNFKKKWSSLTKEDAIELIHPHLEDLKSTPRHWDDYRKENKLEDELPGSFPLISLFESWNDLKQHFNLDVKSAARPHDYTIEQIQKIIEDHPPHVFTSRAWEKFRKEHKGLALPSFTTLCRYITKEKLDQLKKDWYERNPNL